MLSVYATLVISNNNERPLAYALPALVPAALWCLRAFVEETRLSLLPVCAAAVALQVLFWTGQRWAEIGMSIYQPVNWTTVAAMTGGWIVAQVVLRRAERRHSRHSRIRCHARTRMLSSAKVFQIGRRRRRLWE